MEKILVLLKTKLKKICTEKNYGVRDNQLLRDYIVNNEYVGVIKVFPALSVQSTTIICLLWEGLTGLHMTTTCLHNL